MASAFCDYLGVTVSVEDWEAVRAGISPALDSVGASVDYDAADGTLWRAGDGTVRAKRIGPVVSLGASGTVLAAMRVAKSFRGYLSALGAVRHRVTRLDASRDEVADTAPIIARLVDRASSPEGLALTRKRVSPRNVTRLLSRGVGGVDTGTCYVGSKSAEVRACVYDKRQERIDKGLCDVGPLTRYELRLKSQVGASLRDADDPTAVFWHFMAPDILPRPDGVPDWSPHGEGFEVDWPDKPLPAARAQRRVQASADLRDLCRLVNEPMGGGIEFLLGEIRRLHDSRVWAQPTETALGAAPAVASSNAVH